MRWPLVAAFFAFLFVTASIAQDSAAEFAQLSPNDSPLLDLEESASQTQPGAPEVKVEDESTPTQEGEKTPENQENSENQESQPEEAAEGQEPQESRPEEQGEETLPPEMMEQDPFATTAAPELTTEATVKEEPAPETVEKPTESEHQEVPSVPISPVAIEETSTTEASTSEAPSSEAPTEAPNSQTTESSRPVDELRLNEGEVSELGLSESATGAPDEDPSTSGDEDVFAGDKTLFQQEQTMRALTEEFATAPVPPTFPIVELPNANPENEEEQTEGQKEEEKEVTTQAPKRVEEVMIPESTNEEEEQVTEPTKEGEQQLPELPLFVPPEEMEKQETTQAPEEVVEEKKEEPVVELTNIEFNDEFKDPESGSFKKLRDQISHDFKKVLGKVLGDNFVDYEIVEMRPGSVIVDGRIITKQEIMDPEAVAEQMEQVINSNGGTLGGNNVDTKTISVNGFVAKNNVELISDPSASKTGYIVFGAIAIGILIIATAIVAIIIFGVANRRAAGSMKLKDDVNMAENGKSPYKNNATVNL
ncbi:hypothetical protein FO519_004407 [Halicephalobus sp. NKZ332]|nr:hypothetical protein FO519_004407 [Halicephalobus sp. NKZ332]